MYFVRQLARFITKTIFIYNPATQDRFGRNLAFLALVVLTL